MSLAPQHLKDLQGSGLSPELIELAKFRSADRGEVTRILGFDPGSGGLVIPTYGSVQVALFKSLLLKGLD